MALAVALAAALVLAVVVVGAARHRPARLATDRAILAALGLVAVGAVTGLAEFVSGQGPADPLHFLYAALALLILPVARFWDRLAQRRSLALGVAAVVLGALVLRLFQTG